MIQRAKLPNGFTAVEIMQLLDEDMNGDLRVKAVLRSFLRLREGSQFQQNFMLQASLNEAKRQCRS